MEGISRDWDGSRTIHPLRLEGSYTGKGAKGALLQNSGTAQNLSNEYSNNAPQLYGSLAPQLEAESVSPSGYAPSDMSAMRTAAMQSAGGTQGGGTGGGGESGRANDWNP